MIILVFGAHQTFKRSIIVAQNLSTHRDSKGIIMQMKLAYGPLDVGYTKSQILGNDLSTSGHY